MWNKNTPLFQASNIMIWHASDGTYLSDSTHSAKLQYYTTNGFLWQHGGNLKHLFSKYQKLDVHKGIVDKFIKGKAKIILTHSVDIV